MVRKKVEEGASVVAAAYAKRFLEKHYDSLMRSPYTRKLMEAGALTRYGVEAGLYVLIAYLDQNWQSKSQLSVIAKDVMRDAPAEISRRMVNGFREEVLANADKQKSEQSWSIERSLLSLDDESLGALLAFVADLEQQEREDVKRLLSTLDESEIKRFAELSPENIQRMIAFFQPSISDASTAIRDESPEEPGPYTKAIQKKLDDAHKRVDAKLAAKRERRSR